MRFQSVLVNLCGKISLNLQKPCVFYWKSLTMMDYANASVTNLNPSSHNI